MHSRSDYMIQIVGAITVTKDKTDRCHYTEVLTWLEMGGLHQPLKLYNKNESGRNEIPSLPTAPAIPTRETRRVSPRNRENNKYWHTSWTSKLRHWILVINLTENPEHETARQQCTSTIKFHLILRNVCIETVTQTTLNYAQIKQIDVANHSRKAISKTSNSHH